MTFLINRKVGATFLSVINYLSTKCSYDASTIVDNFGERSSTIKLNKSQANKLFKSILHMLENPEESRYREIYVRCNYW